MNELKITIAAPELVAAINNLAEALTGNKPAASSPVVTAEPVSHQPTVVPTASVPVTPVIPAAQPIAPAVPSVAPIQPAPVPTGAPTYTLEMISTAGTALVDAGRMNALQDLLKRYSVVAITQLNPTQYGSFANDLRALGAQI